MLWGLVKKGVCLYKGGDSWFRFFFLARCAFALYFLEMAGRVRVAVRTRPTASFAQDAIFIDPPTVTIHKSPSGQAVDHRTDQWHFKFDHVLHNAMQDVVYDTLCRDVVAEACNGRTGAVLAYGQTGSGKSCTMLGDPQSFRGRGIIPRALQQVYAHILAKPEADYAVSVSYLELYGDKLRDLLVQADATAGAAPGSMSAGLMAGRRQAGAEANIVTAPNPLQPGQFEILEDGMHGTLVRGLTQVPCHSEEDALSALFAAETARTTAEHALNARSNRAHCIFTVHLQQRNRLGGGRERILSSKLHLVDLAGSERLKKTMGVVPLGDSPAANLQMESLAINKSLAVLESVVAALAARGATGGHIPYRSSKLTNILKDALGGGRHPCNSVIIACVWPELRHLDETSASHLLPLWRWPRRALFFTPAFSHYGLLPVYCGRAAPTAEKKKPFLFLTPQLCHPTPPHTHTPPTPCAQLARCAWPAAGRGWVPGWRAAAAAASAAAWGTLSSWTQRCCCSAWRGRMRSCAWSCKCTTPWRTGVARWCTAQSSRRSSRRAWRASWAPSCAQRATRRRQRRCP